MLRVIAPTAHNLRSIRNQQYADVFRKLHLRLNSIEIPSHQFSAFCSLVSGDVLAQHKNRLDDVHACRLSMRRMGAVHAMAARQTVA
jgi:hypothetical protein